ncbi:MAG: Lrp/AsnC family transcriptional regulator [Candidatus Bathyarchaeia archaeon]
MLNEIDKAVLRKLQSNGRIARSILAKDLGLPRATLQRRIAKLEMERVIEGYTALLNPYKLGYKFLSFVLIRARRTRPSGGKSTQLQLAKELLKRGREGKDFPCIEEAHIVTGPYDILLKVWVRRWDDLTKFLTSQLPAYEAVEHTETILVLNRVGEHTELKIE